MKDNLERYITENKEAFNDVDPNPLLWLGVEKKLEKRKKTKVIRLKRVLAIAASFIVVLGLGALIGLNLQSNSQNDFLVQNDEYMEFQEAEHYFQKQVSVKLDEINKYPGGEEIRNDLSQLDAVYNEMKAELLNSPNKDNSAIIQAMIENYTIRIGMLEKILNNLENKSTSHEENITL